MNRTIAPEISLPNKIDLLDVKTLQLQNGLNVYRLDGCCEPIVNLSIYLNAGNYYQNKEFVASYVASLLKKGTLTSNSNEIAEKLDFLGVSLNVSAGMFKMTISLSCLASKLDEALGILKEILTDSTFPQEELDLEKKRRIQRLKINNEKNNYLSSVKFNEVLFGSNHACGSTPTNEKLNAITRDDLLEYFNEIAQFNEISYAVLSGDINEHIVQQIEKHIGSISIKNKFKEINKPFSPSDKTDFFIEKKDSVQASIKIGMHSIAITHPDYLDLEILNRVLGGFFGSRLMKNIREDKGYTYGIYSYLSPFTNGSYFCIATDVGIQYKENVLNEISIEIKRLQTELISEEELQMVKNYHKGRIIKSVDGSLRFANVLSTNLALGVDEERINQQLKAVEEITAERLLNLANKYLQFDEMYKIVVG